MTLEQLRPEEKAALNLRKIYSQYGYKFYRMSRFEEYDFYANKKDFLTSRNILTFTDINGKLMALRPDVTLSIIKHIKAIPDQVQKFFYDEKIYRVPKNANNFRELSQAGIECIGSLDRKNIYEVIELAVKSLETLAGGRRYILDIADAGLIAKFIHDSNKHEIMKCIAEKNIHGLKDLNAPDEIINLMTGESKPAELAELQKIYPNTINIDFSAVSNLNYYNGIIFRGFIEGVPDSILSGGQYDILLHSMGHKDSKAIGFAVYLDYLEALTSD
ncbi:MAG: ATP phosphoribosyltransferase regulatory subunit [Synergistaceae bacterium]|nr:ATP phosphoribosyltransferase regulatory subunit [Synergistaceae bacterium]